MLVSLENTSFNKMKWSLIVHLVWTHLFGILSTQSLNYECETLSTSFVAHRLCNIFSNVKNLPYNWFSSSEVCYWHGVSCSFQSKTQVLTIHLDLSDLNLKGKINDEFKWPLEIESINLSNNGLKSEHSNLLNMLSKNHTIKYFDVSSNHFGYV